jgi:hypothetical protein
MMIPFAEAPGACVDTVGDGLTGDVGVAAAGPLNASAATSATTGAASQANARPEGMRVR